MGVYQRANDVMKFSAFAFLSDAFFEHATDGGLGEDALDAGGQKARSVDAAAEDLIARLDLARDGFAA